jgi:hypothetical protein
MPMYSMTENILRSVKNDVGYYIHDMALKSVIVI